MSQIKITNRYLQDIEWADSKMCDFVIDDRVDIWRICISSNHSFLDDFLSIMNPAEIARANRYFQTKDRKRFIVSRGALRNILGKYLNQSPPDVGFGIGPNKKPYILNTGSTGLQYNISHSGDWIVLAIGNSALGTDTEPVNESFDYLEIIQEYFTADEINFINQTNPVERFFMLWTRKEALTKATGKGLDENLKLIPSLDGTYLCDSNIVSSAGDWLISSFELHEKHVASIANNMGTNGIRFWDIDFNSNATNFSFS